MRRVRWVGLGIALSCFGVSCATPTVARTERAVAEALISPEQERELGLQIHTELERQGVKYVTDPEVLEYVQRLARPILFRARQEAPETEFHLHVIEADDQINAFATPGGHLYLYSGLILSASSDDELAGVIAHEAGHVVGRHAARNLVQALGLNTVAALALGEDPSKLAQVVAQVVGTGALLAHSRSQELEADEFGVRFAALAGYPPGGLVQFLEDMRREEGRTPAVLSWLSTHPTSERRIKNLRAYIAKQQIRPIGRATPPGSLAQVQQRLRAPL